LKNFWTGFTRPVVVFVTAFVTTQFAETAKANGFSFPDRIAFGAANLLTHKRKLHRCAACAFKDDTGLTTLVRR